MHSFDVEVAKDVGVAPAIIFANLRFWVLKNQANDKNFRDGLYWTYNSRKAFGKLFPYLGDGAIRGALQKLIDNGYVIKGEYNQANYDKTSWYAVPLDKLTNALDKTANRLGENSQPIPDSKPVVKPDAYCEALKYLNDKAGSNFQSVASNTKLIKARLIEGHSLETVKKVIDAKVSEWSADTAMKKYLRPATLFNAEKFNQYAGQLEPTVQNTGGF